MLVNSLCGVKPQIIDFDVDHKKGKAEWPKQFGPISTPRLAL